MSDTIDTPRQALTPKTGMRRIRLPFETYQDRSPPLSSKRLLNMYAEKAPDDARAPVILKATPGLEDQGLTCGAGPILAMNGDIPGKLYVVSGDRFYRISQFVLYGPFVVEDLGYVGTPAAVDYPANLLPTIAAGVNAVVVCVPPNAYTCGHLDTSINQIGGDYPGARSVAYLDGYFAFTSDDLDSQFFISHLLDPADFDALDFAYADGVPNMLRRVLPLRGELWLIGEAAMEVWYNAGSSGLETAPGTSFFPFRRRAGAVIPFGTFAMKSFVLCDNSLFFVTSLGVVMRTKGYTVERVSTHAIEQIILDREGQGVQAAVAFIWEGHYCYAISFPDRTVVYDCATLQWHERSTSVNGNEPWLPQATGRLGQNFYFGSRLDGKLFRMVSGGRYENGIDVRRQAILAPLWAETKRAFCSRLEVEVEVGGGLTLDLAWSDDGGFNWNGGPRPLTTGTSRRTRVFTTRLGSFRQRAFTIGGFGDIILYAVDADITPGAH